MAYYFLAPFLPELTLYQKPEMSFEELQFFLKSNLLSHDREYVRKLLAGFDLENLRNYWLDRPILLRGNFDEKEIEEILARTKNGISFIADFLESYTSQEDRIAHFDRLVALFYKEMRKETNPFLSDYFKFEYSLRLYLGALRAKTAGADLSEVLKQEDPSDPLVIELLAQKDSPSISAPEGLEDVQALYEADFKEPERLYAGLIELKWRALKEAALFTPFSIDAILAYLVRFFLVEKSLELDADIGREKISVILRR